MPNELTVEDYQVTVFYNKNGLPFAENVFYYQVETGTGTAADLVGAFATDIVPTIMSVLSSVVASTRVYAINLVDEDDFHDGYATVAGTRGSSVMPPFVGWYFKYLRPTRAVRDGRKNFGGISEGDVTDGLATATALALLETLELVLQGTIEGGSGAIYHPCIAKTYLVPQIADPDKMKRVPYKLYPIDFVNYERVSHQDSRS